jgi:hypothetical protein
MTIRDAILSELGFAPGNANTVDKAIDDQGLTGVATYDSATHLIDVKKVALNILKILLSTPNTSTSTGGVTTSSMTYDRNAILKRIADIEYDLGILRAVPTIKALNIW